MWRCLACGSGYLDPRPTRGSIARAYEAADYLTHAPLARTETNDRRMRRYWVALRQGYLNHRWGYHLHPATPAGRFIVRLLPQGRLLDESIRHLPFPGPGSRLLDVGCGNGRFMMFMESLGWTVEGIDPDAAAIARAREAGLNARLGKAEQLRPEDGLYEAITMYHVIEHLHDPAEAIAHVRSCLKPTGLLYIATPNVRARGHHRFDQHWLQLDPPRHLVLFSRAGLHSLVSSFGFEGLRYERPTVASFGVASASRAIAAGRDPRLNARASPVLHAHANLKRLTARPRKQSGEELVLMATAG